MKHLPREVEAVLLEKPALDWDQAANYGQAPQRTASVLKGGRFSIHIDALRDIVREEVGLTPEEWEEFGLDVGLEAFSTDGESQRLRGNVDYLDFWLREKG